MAKLKVMSIAKYTSDLGREYENLNFKIRDGFETCTTKYTDPERNVCGISDLLTMRHLIATFGDGIKKFAKIKYPVPKLDDIESMVTELLNCKAVCIDLVGEYWRTLPPKWYPVESPNADFPLMSGTFSPKIAGRVKVDSDVLGTDSIIKVAYEADPESLSNVIKGCIGDILPAGICEITTIRSRHAIVYGISGTSKVIRKAPIKKVSEIDDCLTKLAKVPAVQCLGYQGESANRIDLILGSTNTNLPALPPASP